MTWRSFRVKNLGHSNYLSSCGIKWSEHIIEKELSLGWDWLLFFVSCLDTLMPKSIIFGNILSNWVFHFLHDVCYGIVIVLIEFCNLYNDFIAEKTISYKAYLKRVLLKTIWILNPDVIWFIYYQRNKVCFLKIVLVF